MGFDADNTEPQEILRLVDQAVDINVFGLNKEGWSDYRYDAAECFCHGSTVYNTERKTWHDLANGIEAIEMQLGNQLDAHPNVHHRLIIEGVVEPAPQGLLIYNKMQGKNMMSAGLKGHSGTSYKSIMAWLHQVSKYWEVVYTHSMASTASLLVNFYEADQEPEESHKTFHRMFKVRDFTINPQAQKILGAAPDGFGPATAQLVANKFGTLWKAIRAEPEEWMEIKGVGEATARKYLKGIGRLDV